MLKYHNEIKNHLLLVNAETTVMMKMVSHTIPKGPDISSFVSKKIGSRS